MVALFQLNSNSRLNSKHTFVKLQCALLKYREFRKNNLKYSGDQQTCERLACLD